MYISDLQKEYIIQNYNSMLSSNISQEVGVGRKEVLRFAHEAGLSPEAKRTPIASRFDGDYIISRYANTTYQDIGMIVGMSAKQIEGWLRNHCKDKKSKKRVFNSKYFESIDSYIKAYYLGFIYADGWISVNSKISQDNNVIWQHSEFGMEVQERDSYILETLSEEIGGVHPISHYHKSILILNNKEKSECDLAKIRVYSNEFVSCLHNNGIDFNKTLTGVYPVVEEEMFIPFLKGYIDGDGCIYRMKAPRKPDSLTVNITSCTKKVLEYVNESAYKLIGVSGKIYSENEKKHRIVWFRREDVRTLLDVLYSYNTPELKRKRFIYEDFYGLSSQK